MDKIYNTISHLSSKQSNNFILNFIIFNALERKSFFKFSTHFSNEFRKQNKLSVVELLQLFWILIKEHMLKYLHLSIGIVQYTLPFKHLNRSGKYIR